MKLNLISHLQKFKISTVGFLVILFLFVVSIAFYQCRDESLNITNKTESPVNTRGGEDEDPSSSDILDLIGTACVPGSIFIGNGCNDVEYIDTATVSIPGYTGCTVTVVYKYYLCQAGSLIDYTMGDFQILHHNCPAFTSALGSALTTGGATLTNFVESFELAIYNQLQALIIAQYVPINSQYECQHGLFFNIIFIKASCYKRCFFSLSNGAQSYVKVACGVDCCERFTTVCRDGNGALVIDTYYVHPSEPYCTDPPDFSSNPVLTRCDRETSCQYKCLEQ